MGTTEQTERHYLDAIEVSVQKVADHFRREPASFLYEADLRGLLFTRIFDYLSDSVRTWKPVDDCWAGMAAGPALLVNPAKTEYPKPEPFDVAVLVPEMCADKNAWNQNVRVGVEIKLWQADGTGGNCNFDKKKLERYGAKAQAEGRRFTGLCLVFCHLRNDKRLGMWGGGAAKVEGHGGLAIPEQGVRTFVITP